MGMNDIYDLIVDEIVDRAVERLAGAGNVSDWDIEDCANDVAEQMNDEVSEYIETMAKAIIERVKEKHKEIKE